MPASCRFPSAPLPAHLCLPAPAGWPQPVPASAWEIAPLPISPLHREKSTFRKNALRRFPREAPESALHSLLKHSTFSITFLLAEAVAVRTRILGRPAACFASLVLDYA